MKTRAVLMALVLVFAVAVPAAVLAKIQVDLEQGAQKVVVGTVTVWFDENGDLAVLYKIDEDNTDRYMKEVHAGAALAPENIPDGPGQYDKQYRPGAQANLEPGTREWLLVIDMSEFDWGEATELFIIAHAALNKGDGAYGSGYPLPFPGGEHPVKQYFTLTVPGDENGDENGDDNGNGGDNGDENGDENGDDNGNGGDNGDENGDENGDDNGDGDDTGNGGDNGDKGGAEKPIELMPVTGTNSNLWSALGICLMAAGGLLLGRKRVLG